MPLVAAPHFALSNQDKCPEADRVRHEKTLLIRQEYLNHFGTLFGGYMMQWADDMAYAAASLAFPSANFVTRLFGQFEFKAPVSGGDLIKVYSEVESRGTTSCRIRVWAVDARTQAEVFRTFAVMVNVRDGKKVPLDETLPRSGAASDGTAQPV